MKRDLDLIRKILLRIEEKPDSSPIRKLHIEGYSEEEVKYHIDLLLKQNFIEGTIISSDNAGDLGYLVHQLTWRGHDFLDACRDDGVWAKVKEKLKTAGGEIPLKLIISIASDIVSKQLIGT